MKAVELRTLDGPNLFMLRPAIKIELSARDNEVSAAPDRFLDKTDFAAEAGKRGPLGIAHDLAKVVAAVHAAVEQQLDDVVVRELDEPGHTAVAFSWSRRRASKAVGHLSWKLVAGEAVDIDASLAEIRQALADPPDDEDLPEMYPEDRRTIPTIGITGTNGKTTTTRLVSSILRHAGHKVGWTSSSGVFIDDEMVLEGDYTGPSGAARVFEEPGIDYAVLETARGGILLRGLGYEHNDVSVMTNISADHMGLHGVHTLDTLADVKAVVARVTVPDGYAVLNADDPKVLAVSKQISCQAFLFSRHPTNEAIVEHLAANGWASVLADKDIVWHHDGKKQRLASVADVPMTFGGRAEHMVENALAAAGACLAIGLDADAVAAGLTSFRNRPEQNRGRLNVYAIDGATVVVDFAHNEAGLEQLLRFSRKFCEGDGRLVVVIGTAGDRDDNAIRGIGEIAASKADGVIIKDSEKYLRGRETGEMPALLRQVVGARLIEETTNERTGFYAGLDLMNGGDVLAVMCIEDYDEILDHLDRHGTPLS